MYPMSFAKPGTAPLPRGRSISTAPLISGSRLMMTAGLFGIGVIIAGLISVFMPSRDERLISAARGEVLSRLANPSSAVFAEVSVEEERIRSWNTSAVQGCVKSRKPSDQFPTWQGFSVEGNDVSFRSLYCPFLP